jgi:EpsI family protein
VKRLITNGTLRFGLLLGVIVANGILINAWQRTGEVHFDRRQLDQFPVQLGQWKQLGQDQRFDKETEDVLGADDYIIRSYVLPDGRMASFYVGYYGTQRNGATYHSPLNCLPGSGWTFEESGLIKIAPAGRPAFEANRDLVQNGNDREVLIYWYQGRGRAVASEYVGKIYTVLDSVRRRRSDGAMVRVMAPIRNSEESALDAARELSEQASPFLRDYVPD